MYMMFFNDDFLFLEHDYISLVRQAKRNFKLKKIGKWVSLCCILDIEWIIIM